MNNSVIYKSQILKNKSFLKNKAYLFYFLCLYVISILVVDVLSNEFACFIRNTLDGFFERGDANVPMLFKRYFLLDICFGLGLIGGVVALFVIPEKFFCFVGIQRFDEESSIHVGLRVTMTILISSLCLIMLFSAAQGLLFFLPKLLWVILLNLFGNGPSILEITLKDYSLVNVPFPASINLSFIISSIVRMGALVTILQGLFITNKSTKLFPRFWLYIALITVTLSLSALLHNKDCVIGEKEVATHHNGQFGYYPLSTNYTLK